MVGRNTTVQVQLTSLSLGDNFFLLVCFSTSSYASSYQIQGCLFSGLFVAVGSWVLNYYSWAIKAILAHLTMSFQYPHL